MSSTTAAEGWGEMGRPAFRQTNRLLFFGFVALLIAACAAETVRMCSSMAATSGIPMPGGWTLSMIWQRMPGQSWPRAAASFVWMWSMMMAAMMLPSLLPALWRCHAAFAERGSLHPGWPTLLVALGYLLVWMLVGMAVFPVGAAIASAEMALPGVARAAPAAAATVLLLAGTLQFTRWKERQVACFRSALPPPGEPWRAVQLAPWRIGVRLGFHCVRSSAGLTAVLLATGTMELRSMAAVTAAITAERMAPRHMLASTSGMIGLLLLLGGATW